MSQATHLPDTDIPRYTGARALLVGSAVAGAAGLALTFVGAIFSPRPAMLAYLIAFVYWLGLAVGAITLVMANHAAGARWNISVRRFGETAGAIIPLFILLFIPLLLTARHLWFWVDPHDLPKEVMEKLHEKRGYLNFPFFAVRGFVYLAALSSIAVRLRSLSIRQDESGDATFTARMRSMSPVSLLAYALLFTFASFDWLMSLQPTWYSTIFGLYVYAGAFVASVGMLCLVITGVRSSAHPLGAAITVDHQHNAGKLLLAFTAFWAYMAFSQYMLIWAGNLPEELIWIDRRSHGVWRPVGILILLGHFLLPFFLLLSRDLKRSRRGLAAVATWILAIHYVDLYWVVMPAADIDRLGLHWTHFTAFVGIGGVSLASALWLFRAARPLPVGDPFLEDALRYVQP
ncbi:MAG TPA: hypothetical protein VFE90_14755 [Myxococcales bacterium]|nr:hypothetical protein [Myxococcales bacterium]